MSNEEPNNFNLIRKANKDMLDYFNNAFVRDLEDIQDLNTQTFEIDIKIDELTKTKNVYAFKSSSKKSAFTPIINDNFEYEKSKIIDTQINDLKELRESIVLKIKSKETSLLSLKRKLATLNEAETAIRNLAIEYGDILNVKTSYQEDGFEFVEEAPSSLSTHGHNILMQNAFEKAYMSTMLDRNIKDGITSINHKLEMLSYMLSTDISRAKITIKDILSNTNNLINYTDILLEKLDYNIDSSKPIGKIIDDFIMTNRDEHPEFIIDTELDIPDYDVNLYPVFSLNLVKLLNIFFSNIYKHSNANNIVFKVSLTSNRCDVTITDNGMGISDTYLVDSPWYSSLHRAHELIYLLEGKLDIKGDLMGGTTVRFSFPVQIQ